MPTCQHEPERNSIQEYHGTISFTCFKCGAHGEVSVFIIPDEIINWENVDESD